MSATDQAEFYTELAALDAEYEAAKATRDSDRGRWAAAKQKRAEWRTAIRLAAEEAGTRKPGLNVTRSN